jgi:hypothetical protein
MKHSKEENYVNILTAIADATMTLVDTGEGNGVIISFKHYSFCYREMETYFIHAVKLDEEDRKGIHASMVYRLAADRVGRHFMEVYVDEFTTAKQVAEIFATRLMGR